VQIEIRLQNVISEVKCGPDSLANDIPASVNNYCKINIKILS